MHVYTTHKAKGIYNDLRKKIDGGRQTDITNSMSSLGKPSKNEIQQPNSYKKVFDCV